MTVKTQGLIIKETKYGEANKIITILTPDYGVVQAVAKGARSYKSKFLAGCQLFCYTNFELSKKSQLFSVISADPIHTFFEIRKSLEKLSLAVYFCGLLNEVCTDTHRADCALRLALNALYVLSKSECLAQIKAAFELRLISDLGFAPELCCCVNCGQSGALNHFSPKEGGTLCSSCTSSANILLPGTLKAMKHIITVDLNRVFAFKTNDNVLHQLECVAENYVLCQIGISLRSLKYYQKIKC